MRLTHSIRTLAIAAALLAPCAQAATLTVVNNDGAGEGFNDPTPAVPTSSNPGTTLGAQRLFVFQAAANQWGRILDSNVEIKIRAAFNPLTCNGTSAVLGSAGATQIFRDFANAPQPGRWYSVALANSLANTDLNGTGVGFEEINSQFNVSIDNGTCLTGTAGWSYVTKSNDPVPTNRVPLLPVVFHELGHGLGFQTFVDNSTGTLNGGFPDQWTQFLKDQVTGQLWDNLSNAQRQASAISDPNLVWTGPRVNEQRTRWLLPAPVLLQTFPTAATYAAQIASFGPAPPAPAGVSGDVVLVVDPTATPPTGTVNDGCETPFVNAALLAGKIALIERGTCNFTVKVKNAQLAGAIGAIIYNNQAGLPPMGGSDPTVTIPSYGISTADGNTIKAQPVTTVTLGYDPGGVLAGTNANLVRMHAPNPLVVGSSVSHFTLDAFPNLLMEPSLSTAFSEVDLTLPLFRDIGWNVSYIFIGDYE